MKYRVTHKIKYQYIIVCTGVETQSSLALEWVQHLLLKAGDSQDLKI